MRRPTALLLGLCLLAAACTSGGEGSDGTQSEARPSPAAYPFRTGGEGPVPVYDDWLEAACALDPTLVERIRRDYNPEHSPEIVAVPREPNYFGGFDSTSHSGPWPYLQDIPMVFYGPGHIAAKGGISLDREATIADLAPTLAEVMDTPFPDDRPGRAIPEVEAPGAAPPKMVLVVVWDGGGMDVLQSWPNDWPNLKRIMREGTYIKDTTVGSSPSVTPAIHANIGTGAFPKDHGIVDITIRDGNRTPDSFPEKSPKYLLIPTLADLYDQSVNNKAQIGMFGYKGWHLGMLGHGSYLAGGDSDIVAMVSNSGEEILSVEPYYEFPPYANEIPGFAKDLKTIDLEDGKLDKRWMGHDALRDTYDQRHYTPVYILYQTRIVKAILEREGFGDDDITDMFFVNYKPVDAIGHTYNMVEPEVGSAVKYADDMLGELIQFLNKDVGKGEWVMAMTADHGQTPKAESTGAWAISIETMIDDIAAEFDLEADELFQDRRPGHFWLNYPVMKANGITGEDVADAMLDYTIGENTPTDRTIPEQYADRKDEPIFSAVWPTAKTGKVWSCVRG